ARRLGVRTAFRNVPFLDDLQNQEAIKRQLQLAIQGARQKGEAVAIGHPHAETLAALREMVPRAKDQGALLVPVSELVHYARGRAAGSLLTVILRLRGNIL